MSPRRNDVLDELFDQAAWQRGLVRREPVSVFTGIAAALSSGAAAVGGALGIGGAISGGGLVGAAALGGFSLSGAAGSLALGFGINFAVNAIARAAAKDATAVGANTPEVRLNTRQEVPPRRIVYGAPLVGGALFFEECKPPYYYRGFLLSDGPVTGPLEWYNSTTKISVSSSTGASLDVPYSGNLTFSFRDGAADQAMDPILAADFPNLDPNFRQRGIATLVVKAYYGANFDQFQALWGSIQRPNPLLILQGVPVYDPRDPSQILPGDPDDPVAYAEARSTWKFSRTAALIQADYLWRKNGGRIPLHKIRWDEIGESATWDEGMLETKDGEKIQRHTIDGVVTAGQPAVQVLSTMLTANRGFIARNKGQVTVISSQPRAPVLTITDDMIQGGFDFRRNTPKREGVNVMRSRFIDPRQEWQVVDGPVIEDEDYIEEDGDTYEGVAHLPWTSDHRRAQRLQWCGLQDTRRGRAQSLSVDLRAVGLEAGDVVRRYSEVLPRCNGLYRVQEVRFNYVEKTYELRLAEYDSTVDTGYIAADNEQDFELPELDVS
jgi:hypothetical protein